MSSTCSSSYWIFGFTAKYPNQFYDTLDLLLAALGASWFIHSFVIDCQLIVTKFRGEISCFNNYLPLPIVQLARRREEANDFWERFELQLEHMYWSNQRKLCLQKYDRK